MLCENFGDFITSTCDSGSPANAIRSDGFLSMRNTISFHFIWVVRCFDVTNTQACIYETISPRKVQFISSAQCKTVSFGVWEEVSRSVTDTLVVTRNLKKGFLRFSGICPVASCLTKWLN